MNSAEMEELSRDRENIPYFPADGGSLPPQYVLELANQVAAKRNCSVTPTLCNIINNPDQFFHNDQQSASMLMDFQRRKVHSYDTMRKEVIRMKRLKHQPLPNRMDMTNVNPTSITLSLEVESEYYKLMLKEVDNAQNMASIMSETNTLIQMPDRCNSPSISPFVQQVTITGLYQDVEKARVLIRRNCPICVYLELSGAKIDLEHFADLCQKGSIRYEFVTLEVHNLSNQSPPFLRLTCREKDQQYLIKAVEELSGTIFNHSLPNDGFTIIFNVSTYHVEHVIGKPNRNIYLMPLIEMRTRAKITYPKYHRGTDYGQPLFPVTIKGDLEQVLHARKCISELLPVSICVNLKDSDMREPVIGRRNLDVYDNEDRVSIRMTVSFHEPSELLAGEVIHHCVTLRTKEFNMRALYNSYHRLLSERIEVNPPQPTEFDCSMWIREARLDQNIMTFKLPCRGETPDPNYGHSSVPMPANRSEENHVRAHDIHLQKTDEAHSVNAHDIPGPSGVNTHAVPMNPGIQNQYGRFVGYTPVKGYTDLRYPMPIPQFLCYIDPSRFPVPPECIPQGIPPDDHRMFMYPGCFPSQFPFIGLHRFTPSEGDTLNGAQHHRRVIEQQQQQQAMPPQQAVPQQVVSQSIPIQRNSSSSAKFGSCESRSVQSGSIRHTRVFESVRVDDDAKSSTMSHSRRTSISGDDVIVGSYESVAQSDRVITHRGMKGNHWKGQYSNQSNQHHHNYREPYYSKKNMNYVSKDASYRNNSKEDASPIDSSPSGQNDQFSFTTTHHLMLKTPNDNDRSLDRESLFTQDNSQVEEKHIPIKNHIYSNHVVSTSAPTEYGNRIRTTSFSQTRDENVRFSESDKQFPGPEMLAFKERHRKSPTTASVSKVILEPKTKNEKTFTKINLEHRDKLISDEGYSRINDVKKFIKDVARESGKYGKMEISNRTYADILKEKNEEMMKCSALDGIEKTTNSYGNLTIIDKEPNLASAINHAGAQISGQLNC